MPVVTDVFAGLVVLLTLIAFPLVLLAVPALIVGGFVYLIAGPQFRLKMVGWAPGVQHGVKKTLALAQALQGRSPGQAR